MIDFVRSTSGRTAWLASLTGLALLILPARAGAQPAIDQAHLGETGLVRPVPTARMPAPSAAPGYGPVHAAIGRGAVGRHGAAHSSHRAWSTTLPPADAGAREISWRHAGMYVRVHARSTDAHWRQAEEWPRRNHPALSSDDDPHPLRGTLATIGGLLAGLGVGLAVDEPAAGLFVGTGVGMITTAFLRAFGD